MFTRLSLLMAVMWCSAAEVTGGHEPEFPVCEPCEESARSAHRILDDRMYVENRAIDVKESCMEISPEHYDAEKCATSVMLANMDTMLLSAESEMLLNIVENMEKGVYHPYIDPNRGNPYIDPNRTGEYQPYTDPNREKGEYHPYIDANLEKESQPVIPDWKMDYVGDVVSDTEAQLAELVAEIEAYIQSLENRADLVTLDANELLARYNEGLVFLDATLKRLMASLQNILVNKV